MAETMEPFATEARDDESPLEYAMQKRLCGGGEELSVELLSLR